MARTKVAVMAVIASLGLVATACSMGSETAETADGRRTITVALSGGENPLFAPYLAAVGSGAFERRGIEIKQDVYANGTLSFSAFTGGSADFCICGATQVLTAGAQGLDVVGVFNQYLGGAVVFIGAKRFEQSRGTDLAAYDGAKWGYTAEGSVSQVFMIRAAQSAGLDWERQGRIAVGSIDAYIPSLQQGLADIIAMDATSAAKAISLGVGYAVLNTNDTAKVAPIWGKQLGLPLVTSRAYADENPELTQQVVDAMREGQLAIAGVMRDPAAVLQLMPESFRASNGELFPQIWAFATPGFADVDGTFGADAVADTIAFAESTGALQPLDPQERAEYGTTYFDSTFAQRAVADVK